jgi:hypothetical protein
MIDVAFYSQGSEAMISGLEDYMTRIATIQEVMDEAAALVYEATEFWMESNGDGTWPALAGATIKKRVTAQKKGRFTSSDLYRPLYVTGELFHSAIGPGGPYSRAELTEDGIILGIEWEKDGYNIAEVLARGTDNSGPGGATKIPARPIWPPTDSALGIMLRRDIGKLIQEHIRAPIGGPIKNSGGKWIAPAGGFGGYGGGQFLPSSMWPS